MSKHLKELSAVTFLASSVMVSVVVLTMLQCPDGLAQSRTVRERNQSMAGQSNSGGANNLPETRKLYQNNNLFPGQSRTQAMRLEAETGHINPTEDAVLKNRKPTKMVKTNRNAQVRSVVRPALKRGVRH